MTNCDLCKKLLGNIPNNNITHDECEKIAEDRKNDRLCILCGTALSKSSADACNNCYRSSNPKGFPDF